MEQKALDNDLKILSSYISSALKSLEIWAQVYEITNPITNFRAKNEKRLGKVYEWLVFLNMVFWRYALIKGLLSSITMIY